MITTTKQWIFLLLVAFMLVACDETQLAYLGYEKNTPLTGTATQTYAQSCQCLYPQDPDADIPWQAKSASVVEIAKAFNRGRRHDATIQLDIRLPSQLIWDRFSVAEKMLYLINSERQDRGLEPWSGFDDRVSRVAQEYADYLRSQQLQGHFADKLGPWQRLAAVTEIQQGSEKATFVENIAYFANVAQTPQMPVERSVFHWLYNDAVKNWGHRHFLLYTGFNDNSGAAGEEAVMGIGIATGPYSIDGVGYPYGTVVVVDAIDPNAQWDYMPLQRVSVQDGGFSPYDSNGQLVSADLISDLNQGLLRDSTTRLTWLDNSDVVVSTRQPTIADFRNGANYCAQLTSAGFTDWRMPTSAELSEIIRKVTANPMIDFGFDVPGWCPASVALDGALYRGVLSMPYGSGKVADVVNLTGSAGFIRCVRDGLE